MIVKVKVHRAEGPNDLCGTWEFSGHQAETLANIKLREISRTAPKGGGHDKCDVTITLDSGEEITSRHDVEFNNIDGTVRDHAEKFLSFYVESDKADMLERRNPGFREYARKFLQALRA